MRKEDHAEIVFPCLQADRGKVTNIFFGQNLAKLLKAPSGKRGQRLLHLGHAVEGDESASPVGEFAEIFSRPTLLQLAHKFRGKATLRRRQDGAPALGDTDNGATSGQWRYQP